MISTQAGWEGVRRGVSINKEIQVSDMEEATIVGYHHDYCVYGGIKAMGKVRMWPMKEAWIL